MFTCTVISIIVFVPFYFDFASSASSCFALSICKSYILLAFGVEKDLPAIFYFKQS